METFPLNRGKLGDALLVRPCTFCGQHKLGQGKCEQFKCPDESIPKWPHYCGVVCKDCRDKYCTNQSDGCPLCCRKYGTLPSQQTPKWVFNEKFYDRLAPIIDELFEKSEAANKGLGRQILDLNVDIRAQDKSIKDLEDRLSSTEAEGQNAQAEIQVVIAENAKLEAENAKLKAENEYLRASDQASNENVARSQQELRSMENTIEWKEEELGNLEKERSKDTRIICMLRQQLAKMQQTLKNIKIEVEQHTDTENQPCPSISQLTSSKRQRP